MQFKCMKRSEWKKLNSFVIEDNVTLAKSDNEFQLNVSERARTLRWNRSGYCTFGLQWHRDLTKRLKMNIKKMKIRKKKTRNSVQRTEITRMAVTTTQSSGAERMQSLDCLFELWRYTYLPINECRNEFFLFRFSPLRAVIKIIVYNVIGNCHEHFSAYFSYFFCLLLRFSLLVSFHSSTLTSCK